MNNEPFLRGYRTMRIPIIDDTGAPAWPEMFPIAKIDELRASVGARHFASQMMLTYTDATRARLDPAALQFYDGDFDPRAAKIENTECSVTGVSCYWDPSSARDGADSSVIVLVYRDDKNRRAFIHDIKYLRTAADDMHPFATQCGRVLDFMRAHDLRHLAVEVNGIGNALPEILRGAAAARGIPIVIGRVINHENKERRILDAIEPLLSTGRLFARDTIRHTKLIDEMADWLPTAGANHDDGIDAVAGALRIAPIAVRPRGQMFLPFSAKTEFSV